jgi:hypothetical protein
VTDELEERVRSVACLRLRGGRLEVNADIATGCGSCEQPRHLRVERAAVLSDSSLVLWLPEGQHTNLREEFCPLANLFCNDEHLAVWRASSGASAGRLLTVAEAAEIGRSWWGQSVNGVDPPPFR